MSETVVVNGQERTFDYVPKLDDRSNNFLVRDHARLRAAPDVAELWGRPRQWMGGTVLDQGSEGTCVGHGVVGEYLATPVRGRLLKLPNLTPEQVGHILAVKVFDWAALNDEWAGEARADGTSVNAGMKAGREFGWWDDWHWAKNMAELRMALELGPVVLGVTWTDKMYTAVGGRVEAGGSVVGGHCLLLTGYFPQVRGMGTRWRWRNSWGPGYGSRGNGYITNQDLNSILFEAGNEAAVATGRHLGRAD